ncbi:MAG: ABC transporter ATP-binding protein/permease [Clostridium sp.]|nr:ABC transporter ATP-binding protein/permease [Acetatifactor muris]MCM1527809.1 ABC transporter ATP-binding protein/permease [Bacteroides sp.]MCM1563489.1 ABC transporter ATP-binding protein/permease [Clostridium sp.]
MRLTKLFIRTMKIMGGRAIVYLAGIFFMSTGWAMFTVMSSLLVKNVVDAAQTGDVSRMRRVIVGNIAGGLIAMLVYRAAAIAYNVEAKRAYGKVCKILYAHEVRLPYTYYEEHHSGDFMSKLSYDLEKMGSIYGSRLRRTVAPILQVIVYLIPMLLLSPQITLCLVVVNLLMLGLNGIFIKPMQRVAKDLAATNGKMTEKLSNLLQGMEQARMYAAGRETVSEFVEQNHIYARKNRRKILYTACLESGNSGFDLLCALAFLMVGIYFVGQGETTLGALAAIYSLYGNFSNQFLQLGRYLPELVGCLANAENIFTFMEEPEEPESWYAAEKGQDLEENGQDAAAAAKGRVAAEKAPAVSVRDIRFSYRQDKPLLKEFSMHVDKGESVAVTGPSGCGKTTLSKLLLGLYPIESGEIRLMGRSYGDMTNAEIRQQISYVPQEPYLFRGTIRENILVGRTDATEEEIVRAAKLAYAHDFIEKLEKGYDTDVGERGNRLSGGQRQRIAIARAILKEAPLILLDEATSALDNESEQLVNQALKELHRQRTLLMIAHRPSTIALADRTHSEGFGG